MSAPCHVCGASACAHVPIEVAVAPPPPVAVASAVRVRAYHVIATAIEHACEAGVHRAHKHADAPSRDAIATACADAVKLALCDVLDFGDEP